MASMGLRNSDWKRQQSCPIIRTNKIEAKADMVNVVRRSGTAKVASNRPAVARKPMPSPREEGCTYVDQKEVHSYGHTVKYGKDYRPAISRSPNRSPVNRSQVGNGDNTAQPNTTDGNNDYLTVVEGDLPEDDSEFAYDYTRFQSQTSPKQRNSGSYYKVLEADGNEAYSSDEDDPYSEPRNMLGATEPPNFAAPSLPKSRSFPDSSAGSVSPRCPRRDQSQRPVSSGSPKVPPHVDLSVPRNPSPKMRSNRPPSKNSSTRHSPLTNRIPSQSIDSDDEDHEYDYPSMDRVALPFFKRSANTGSDKSPTGRPALRQKPPNAFRAAHTVEVLEEEGAYVYNEPLDPTFGRGVVSEDHLYDSGMPNSAIKPSIRSKPSRGPIASKPALPQLPPKPSARPSKASREETAENGDDNDDIYYDPPVQQASAPKRAYLQLHGEPTPWYHGVLSRSDAERLLSSHPCGAYLLRDGQKHRGYTLSMSRGAGQCRHFQVNELDDHSYKLGSFDNSHKTVHQLILFCHQHPINSAGEKLTSPLPLV